ncbi:NAD(P)H-dependent oxidoreductase [Alteromonas sp. M12]|uniref:NAD(P)H-dependent oxidoreductase n=1 Tax=Alteromonas sp. M12 TaxID=3135644 RepID=UPI00319E4A59
MKIGIICGSQRAKSQTSKVGLYIQQTLNSQDVNTFLLDLGKQPLANFDDSFWYEKQGSLQTAWQPIAKELQSCDGFIVLTPDWHGMVPSCLKNFFLFSSAAEMANKPGLIVAISASVGGYLPVAELRISSYKNNRICWIPDHIIVRNVKLCMNDTNPPENQDDIYIRTRLQHSINLLTEYAKALSAVRNSQVADYKTYQYGM